MLFTIGGSFTYFIESIGTKRAPGRCMALFESNEECFQRFWRPPDTTVRSGPSYLKIILKRYEEMLFSMIYFVDKRQLASISYFCWLVDGIDKFCSRKGLAGLQKVAKVPHGPGPRHPRPTEPPGQHCSHLFLSSSYSGRYSHRRDRCSIAGTVQVVWLE